MSGRLHQVYFEVVDEKMAYVVTAKMFALMMSELLKDAIASGKELAQNYKSKFPALPIIQRQVYCDLYL